MNQCQEAIQNLQDPALKNQAQQMEQKHKQIFLTVFIISYKEEAENG